MGTNREKCSAWNEMQYFPVSQCNWEPWYWLFDGLIPKLLVPHLWHHWHDMFRTYQITKSISTSTFVISAVRARAVNILYFALCCKTQNLNTHPSEGYVSSLCGIHSHWTKVYRELPTWCLTASNGFQSMSTSNLVLSAVNSFPFYSHMTWMQHKMYFRLLTANGFSFDPPSHSPSAPLSLSVSHSTGPHWCIEDLITSLSDR